MWIADEVILLELQKCVSTRIATILDEQVGGRRRGKHDRFAPVQSDRMFIGSIRNPWSWYVSLWAFGCDGRGQIFDRVTGPRSLRHTAKTLKWNGPGIPGRLGVGLASHRANRRRDPADWRRLYSDATDVDAFREWLGLITDPSRSYQVDLRYGASGLADSVGLLTFWYLWLYARREADVFALGSLDLETSLEFDRAANCCASIIRLEAMGDDILAALETVGLAVDAERRAAISAACAVRDNTSDHLPTAAYYDDRSRALVAEREAFIVAKHGYDRPLG